MKSIFPYLIITCLLVSSCREHQPTSIPAPDPRMETFSFNQLFMELTLDQAGTPWLRSVEYMENGDPLSGYVPLVNTICRFEEDSLIRFTPVCPTSALWHSIERTSSGPLQPDRWSG
jgi:hypothetical protein